MESDTCVQRCRNAHGTYQQREEFPGDGERRGCGAESGNGVAGSAGDVDFERGRLHYLSGG